MTYLGFVWPGTHTTNAAGATNTPALPYGAYLRLKPSFNVSGLPCGANGCGAQVIAKALQTYGMILADGGHITLTAKSDTYSTLKYENYFSSNFSNDLASLQPSDFEVVAPPGVPSALPAAAPASFITSGQAHSSFFTTPISTVASNPTIVPDITCYRNSDYSYLTNFSVTNPPASTASEWTSSESGCTGVNTLTDWINCQFLSFNN